MRHRPGASSVVLVAVLAVVVPVCAVAQDGDSPEVQAPAEAGRPSGATVLVASAVYPGLGQLLNGAEPKAAVVSVAEAFLVAGLVLEDRRTRNAFRLYEQTGEARYFDDYSEHYDKRQALVWWVVVAALAGNLATGRFNLGFEDQPIAHTAHLWNFLGMALVGLGSVLLGGCPLRQLVLAGNGNTDSALTVFGMLVGAAVVHNFGLAKAASGYGKAAVIAGLVVTVLVGLSKRERT